MRKRRRHESVDAVEDGCPCQRCPASGQEGASQQLWRTFARKRFLARIGWPALRKSTRTTLSRLEIIPPQQDAQYGLQQLLDTNFLAKIFTARDALMLLIEALSTELWMNQKKTQD